MPHPSVPACIALTLAACAHPTPQLCDIAPQPPFVVTPDTTPPGILRGLVVSLPDSAPIVGALVLIEGTAAGAVADSLGQFQLAGLAPDSLTLVVLMPNYRRARFRLGQAPAHGLRLRIPLTLSCFQVQVVPLENRPPPNQRLKLSARGGRVVGNRSVLSAAAAGRSLSAIR
jgi:hypothetical protein